MSQANPDSPPLMDVEEPVSPLMKNYMLLLASRTAHLGTCGAQLAPGPHLALRTVSRNTFSTILLGAVNAVRGLTESVMLARNMMPIKQRDPIATLQTGKVITVITLSSTHRHRHRALPCT